MAVERAEADAEADSEAEWESEADPLREGSWYLSPKLRQRLLEEHGVESRTLLQFYGDTVIIPAGALHQVLHTLSVTLYLVISHASIKDKDRVQWKGNDMDLAVPYVWY